ncbi:UDP-N-acetylmuramoyl-tripeptide--D-alanyl-D-alanine ligase [Polaribacter pacificus]|uniref:UDP-N-acetylmuramoyl-tripeptide--D-alanyl-D-alanine ligase n=1 Tax=Polaribacter pacificus TaxID=1775173 RepID=A0A917MEU7_9FLAO|nr:UDP-N-acetylmuramoyl-tripeptide--D-alanyl-D-alanine ligase [Polaribacter pacificus]GGH01600.1 UDP-N-acetylmuramoyl-tripeptide--D-alanyl-D-alanine ligase [Polaribacter pacificus]
MTIANLYKLYAQHYLVDTDTRSIRENTLYFALKGANFNGNTFAQEALSKGALYSIVDEKDYATSDQIILVDNVLETLQQLASYHRNQLGLPIIALTGSNGKTTTKELIHSVLKKKFTTTATKGNLNNHIGVPLTLLSMTPKTEIGIVEMGANHPKEIAFLCQIAQPNFGYITNFGKAHLEGFGSLEGVIEAKSELYNYLKENNGIAFVNPKDAKQVEKTIELQTQEINFNQIKLLEVNPYVKVGLNKLQIQSHLIGTYNFTNIAAAITIGHYFKVSNANCKDALEKYIPENNRSQVIKSNENTIILDAYNANPTSMSAALESFSNLQAVNKLIILGDMFELGLDSEIEHQKIVEKLEQLNFTNCFLVGKLFMKTKSRFTKLNSTKELKELFTVHPPKNYSILIKGSRGMALEQIVALIP